ncbi:molybdate-binding protein [Mycolicibacterium madagascariense]|uniref:Molybdate-binding protein n=1 Tax=Mycolicibacterium madagascariense TaxID=212765 RepID=A0A7I7XLW6_9MYCO|nr:molybdate ABC transporter substrate-binding protein [Mycolicibacterium madagascariense]BBZ30207.1 molybdate-binding protein [Mycolicibacterium madagascariense]
MTTVAAAGAVVLVAATGCATRQEPTVPLTVYATSSLIKTFTTIGKKFEADHPGFSVQFVFSGSSDLSSALAQGADADVFASGDAANMAVVSDAGAISGAPVPFASNRLVVATAPGNPRRLASLADLAAPGLRVALCTDQSACGTATEALERANGVHLTPEAASSTARHVLSEVTSGRADAGVVFMPDALAAGNKASWFPLPGDGAAVTAWIAVVKGTTHEQAAEQFVQEVTSAEGGQILADDGFSQPPKRASG